MPVGGSIPPGLVANSAAPSRLSSRPPGASETARSSFINRTGVVPPGTPGASRGLSASGQSMVTAMTMLEPRRSVDVSSVVRPVEEAAEAMVKSVSTSGRGVPP